MATSAISRSRSSWDAGEGAANLRGFARFRFLDDGDFLLDLRSLQRLALADFLLFHFPAPFEHETLLFAQDTRTLVGDFFFLFRSRDCLVPVELQNPKPRFEAPSTDGDRGLFADLVALVARAVFRGRDRCGAGDLCLLPLALFGGEIDILFALGALACEIAGDFGDLGFARLVDQGDLTVAAFLFQRELFLHLRYFAPLCLCREGDVALGAQLLKRFFVFDLALFYRQALVEHESLLLAQLLGLFVGDVLVLAGAGNRLLAFDFEQFELRGQILVADRDRGLLFGGMHLAPGFRCDLGDDLEAFGVEHVIGPEIFLRRLLEGDDGHLFEHQAVRSEALADALLDLLRERVAVLVQFLECLGGGEAAQRADHFGFEQVADLLGVEGFFAERAAGGENCCLGVADVSVQFGVDVDADIVVRQNRLLAGAADCEFDGFQRDPRYLVEYRQHDRAPSQAHLGAEKAGADEAHVGRRALINPNRDDVEDRDEDDRGDEETDHNFNHRAFALFADCSALPLTMTVQLATARSCVAPALRSPKSNNFGVLRLRRMLARNSSVAR